MATNADPVRSLSRKIAGGTHVGFARPWRGEQYAEHKERFFRYVRQNRYEGKPTQIQEAVSAVYGGDYDTTQYNRLMRLAKRCDWFVVDSDAYPPQVEVTPDCFRVGGLESAVSVSAKDTPSCDSDLQSAEIEETGDESRQYPRDRIQSILGKRVRLDSGKYEDKHDYRQELLRELATYRSQIDGKYSYLKRKHAINGLPDYLALPYTTRFNDAEKAASIQRGFTGALETSARRFDVGAMVSLTVDGNRFETNADALEAATKAKSDWINREEHQLGGRPTYLCVVDFQENGLIHFHVCVFGVRVVDGETETGEPTLSEKHVRGYWDEKKGIGSQVAVQPIHEREGDWILHEDGGGRQTVRLYLGKRIRQLADLVEKSPEELKQMATDGNLTMWRQAMFFATGKQYYTASESLETDAEDDSSGSKYSWVYLGTCRFEQIPQYVLDDAIVCRKGRPPPSGTGATAEVGAPAD
ncbi:hypothetical protein [Halorubrum miltondacostae]|uniref:Transposase n=1 Tax=Halorubrum miltondacostae TaxID=3076378 RepID=A0ABD5M6U9_9EURY